MTRKQNFRYLCHYEKGGVVYHAATVTRAKHQEAALHEYMAKLSLRPDLPAGGWIRVELEPGQVKELNPCSGIAELWNGEWWRYDRMGGVVV
jgi:hypothetical protein